MKFNLRSSSHGFSQFYPSLVRVRAKYRYLECIHDP